MRRPFLCPFSGVLKISHLQAKREFVMPAKAGIHLHSCCKVKNTWIPACAGMTEGRVDPSREIQPSLGSKSMGIQLSLRQSFPLRQDLPQ